LAKLTGAGVPLNFAKLRLLPLQFGVAEKYLFGIKEFKSIMTLSLKYKLYLLINIFNYLSNKFLNSIISSILMLFS